MKRVLSLTLCALCLILFSAHAADPRPSILFALADDWSFPHAGVYGDKVIKTPTFDRIAKEGVLFKHSYCASPSCTPSRGAILTGQAVHRLESGANLWSTLPLKFQVYPDLLEAAGYGVGYQGKGWAPGALGERTRNPAGPQFKGFAEFLKTVPPDKPFCFWYGSRDPHRPYKEGQGLSAGMKIEDVTVPPFLPDTPEVRGDILDYYFAVQRFDRDTGEILKLLEESGRAANTIVVMTSDNGWPFPRAKANLYDIGTHMPLAIRWPAKVQGGRTVDAFVGHTDFAPTFLEAAGLKPLPEMTGRSLLRLLCDQNAVDAERDKVFLERERHANVRKGDLGYPCRALRTQKFLYVRNLCPDRFPAGDPEMWKAVGPYGDIDDGPSKQVTMKRRNEPGIEKFARLALDKRPAEELFDLVKDPAQLFNVVNDTQYADAKKDLRAGLDLWMKDTGDPRAAGDTDIFDKYPYVTNPKRP
ncbi:MAG: sulfatase [Planctomycetota bacterium]|nr:sulfatase [Planctomycetota bacterium]